jgi:hypothetical protein|tara:strand:+ start:157 stop:558 length:402 start_codon:yes stop_codon:yes gene_type:complete
MAAKERVGSKEFGREISIADSSAPPGLSDVLVRLKKNRKAWSDLRDQLTSNPQNFDKPERFIDDRMPIPGPLGKGRPPAAAWFGGGYEGRIRLRLSDKSIKVTSNRPFLPLISDAAIDNVIIPELLEWWLDGE